jgi:hypothetical protein
MTRAFNRVDLDYVAWAKPRGVSNVYDEVVVQPPQHFRLSLRDDPFTLEMYHVARSRQVELASIVTADIVTKPDQTPLIGGYLEESVLCRLETTALQDQVATNLGATEVAVYWVGNGNDKLGFCSLGSDESISVRLQADYLAQVARFPFREESKRTWVFWTRHGDGYVEKAYYDVKLIRGSYVGEMTISRTISDTALQNLRENVVALF